MKETCWTCRFMRTEEETYNPCISDDIDVVMTTPYKTRKIYLCCVYPKRREVDRGHWCGQYQCDTERIELLEEDKSDEVEDESENTQAEGHAKSQA